ncbi:MAG: hypothetical protein ACYDEJ_06545 [Desulfitobacteriaceae bacterium]
MSMMRVFWALVDNDYRLGFHFRYIKNSEWKYFSLLVILLGMGLYTSTRFAEVFIIVLSLITNLFNPFLLFVIPFLFTKQVIDHEWKNGTAGWWLSLSYSRTFLLAAKGTVGFFRFLKILLIFVPVIMFLILVTSTMQPDAGNARVLHHFPQMVLYNSAIGIILSPFSLALSSLIAVLDKSRIKKVLPFLPPAIFLIFFLSFSSLSRSTLYLDFFFHPAWSSSFIVFGFSLGLGALLFFFAVYVLEHKIDL